MGFIFSSSPAHLTCSPPFSCTFLVFDTVCYRTPFLGHSLLVPRSFLSHTPVSAQPDTDMHPTELTPPHWFATTLPVARCVLAVCHHICDFFSLRLFLLCHFAFSSGHGWLHWAWTLSFLLTRHGHRAGRFTGAGPGRSAHRRAHKFVHAFRLPSLHFTPGQFIWDCHFFTVLHGTRTLSCGHAFRTHTYRLYVCGLPIHCGRHHRLTRFHILASFSFSHYVGPSRFVLAVLIYKVLCTPLWTQPSHSSHLSHHTLGFACIDHGPGLDQPHCRYWFCLRHASLVAGPAPLPVRLPNIGLHMLTLFPSPRCGFFWFLVLYASFSLRLPSCLCHSGLRTLHVTIRCRHHCTFSSTVLFFGYSRSELLLNVLTYTVPSFTRPCLVHSFLFLPGAHTQFYYTCSCLSRLCHTLASTVLWDTQPSFSAPFPLDLGLHVRLPLIVMVLHGLCCHLLCLPHSVSGFSLDFRSFFGSHFGVSFCRSLRFTGSHLTHFHVLQGAWSLFAFSRWFTLGACTCWILNYSHIFTHTHTIMLPSWRYI